jgi:uncharacterized membrane protein YuzA (DUF378 family)
MDKDSLEYPLYMAAQLFVFLGALNWGTVGAFGINALEFVFPKTLLKSLYTVVGLSAAYLILCRFR